MPAAISAMRAEDPELEIAIEEGALAELVTRVQDADHRLARREEVALRELAEEPWVAPSPDGIVVRACREAGFEPRLAIHTRDPLALRAVAAAGLAESITPRLVAGLGLPGIATPRLRGRAPRRTLYAVVPATGAHPLTARLVDELVAAMPPDARRPAVSRRRRAPRARSAPPAASA